MRESIFGIVPPMTTPFRPDDTIDEAALRAETRYLIEAARVHGLAASGSTGEGHALSTDEVRRVVAIVTEEARGRVPVIAGIITDSTASAVERGLAVKDLGVAALQVTPVHYLCDISIRSRTARSCPSSSTTWCRGRISRLSSSTASFGPCPG